MRLVTEQDVCRALNMYIHIRHSLLIMFILLSLYAPSTIPAAQNAMALRRTPTVIAVEKISPAVVNISTEQLVRSRSSQGFSDPFFDRFFRDFLDPRPRRQYKQNSLGSGVIIDARGYVLTNYHVIARASKITVTLADQREFNAEIAGSDPKSDLAVLKLLTTAELPVAAMGRSDDIMIGEPVIAIGNPFGLSHTITTGVISAVNRSIRVEDDRIFRGLLQTDTPINPGNSGGPLINILGDVIGVNTAIYGDAEGIGFAIPIEKVIRIIDDLIGYGRVRAAWLGIQVQDITPAIARYFKYDGSDGVLVAQVVEGSSAHKSDLRQGDILLEINGHALRDLQSYNAILSEYTADDLLTLSLLRKGEQQTVNVYAEEFTIEQAARFAQHSFGFSVAAIDEAKARKYRLRTLQGVVISGMRDSSAAFQAGLEPGDVIRQIEGIQIHDMEDFRQVMMALGQAHSVVFLIQRGERGYYVTLER